MCAVAMAVGAEAPRFVALSCINIVVAANAGGAFSPFGDITTLMVWQKGVVAFGDFFRLFLPVGREFPRAGGADAFRGAARRAGAARRSGALKIGARRIALLFVADHRHRRRGAQFSAPAAGARDDDRARLSAAVRLPPAMQRHRRGRDAAICSFDVFHRHRGGRVGHAAVLLRRDAVRRRAGPARLSVADVASAVWPARRHRRQCADRRALGDPRQYPADVSRC